MSWLPVATMLPPGLFSGRCYGATGAWLGGYLFDHTGSYQPVWLEIIAAYLLAGAVVWLVAPRKVRRVPGQAGAGEPRLAQHSAADPQARA